MKMTDKNTPILKYYFDFKHYLDKKKLTDDQAKALSKRLHDEKILELIDTNVISAEIALDLRDTQCLCLSNDSIRQRLIKGELDIAFVDYSFLQDYVNEKILTLDQAKTLSTEFDNQKIGYFSAKRLSTWLKNENARKVIFANITSLRILLEIRGRTQWEALIHDDSIMDRVISGELDIAFVDYPLLQQFVNQNKLTLAQAETLSTEFYNQEIDYLDAWRISRLLYCENFRKLIFDNVTSLETFTDLRWSQWDALDDDSIRDRFIRGELNINFVDCPTLQLAVDDNRVDLNFAIWISRSDRPEKIHRLIYEGILSEDQYYRLTSHHYDLIIDNDDHYQWLLERRITIDDILRIRRGGIIDIEQHEERLRAGVNELQNEPINDSQSTHTSSVHRSVSASAARLMESYGDKIKGGKLEKVISDLKKYVSSLDDESQITKSAKKCIERITQPDYTYTDKTSNISILQLLALTFLAINDSGKRKGSLPDALSQYKEGLYEIQRGYNLTASGTDDGQNDDAYICTAGTFNKLIEKLQGIHPDCEVVFVTPGQASLKLPKVVKEVAMRHLGSLASPKSSEEVIAFTQLISEVKDNGIEVIWNSIKEEVAHKIFEEFNEVFKSRNDKEFNDLIQAGLYVDLGDLKQFEEQLEKSEGYRKNRSNSLRGSGIFSKAMQKNDKNDKNEPSSNSNSPS